jgi:anti-sigma-K factor RskA
MSSSTKTIPPQLIDLMVEDATQGLSPQDEQTLSAALAQDDRMRVEAEAYAMAATAVEVALIQPQRVEALPTALREALIAQASQAVATPSPQLKLSGSTPARTPAAQTKFSFTDGRMFGWYAAAAALIALAFVTAFEPKTQPDGTPETPTLAQQYEALAEDADTVAATWGFNADGGDPAYANATGEVIWNADEQTGYMKLAGLPVNDPNQFQYQLWIVDPARDAEPIDGGVFDITAEGEVIVPIDAKLRSDNPAVFAITAEQPGGVVVSEGPLQVVAAVDKS